MRGPEYFFLDFDGVVCDSIPECFLSSHTAYKTLFRGETVTEVSLREKKLFYAYRPFIRSGEDYILIHDMIRRGVEVESQEIFDREIEKAGAGTMKEYGRLFYRAREALLASEREFWLDLNPLFAGMAEILRAVASHPNFYILSTKKPPFILEILSHNAVTWEEGRVLFPGDRTKKEVIESYLPPEKRAIFVDDQLDHLLAAAKNPNIVCALAKWGYVKKPWLEQKEIPVIGEKCLLQFAEGFFRESFPGG